MNDNSRNGHNEVETYVTRCDVAYSRTENVASNDSRCSDAQRSKAASVIAGSCNNGARQDEQLLQHGNSFRERPGRSRAIRNQRMTANTPSSWGAERRQIAFKNNGGVREGLSGAMTHTQPGSAFAPIVKEE
jgi:hypothetical protein